MPAHPVHLCLVSQKVKDIKVPPAFKELSSDMCEFRLWLQKYAFMRNDKFTTTLKPVKVDQAGVFHVICELPGIVHVAKGPHRLEAFVEVDFALQLRDCSGTLEVDRVFEQVEGVEVDDGGNIQNMSLNMLSIIDGLQAAYPDRFGPDQLQVSIASSSDPFSKLDEHHEQRFRAMASWFKLELPDRYAIQVPWSADEEVGGTLTISSDPARTAEALEGLIEEDDDFRRRFNGASCIVSADPLFDLIRRHATPPFIYVINASTAFRSLAALEAYNTATLLPMNNHEAADVLRLLQARGNSTELDETKTPPFPSPLTTVGDSIDTGALKDLDGSLDLLFRYNPLYRKLSGTSYAAPVSFGPDGGLVVGCGPEANIACFTSIPSHEGEQALLRDFGDPAMVTSGEKLEVGAGDSVASVIALFNLIDPTFMITEHMKGREPGNRALASLASTIFVTALGRIVGSLLLRTSKTYLANIRRDRFPLLLQTIAEQCLDLARAFIKKLDEPFVQELKPWGISVTVWRAGHIVYPDGYRALPRMRQILP